MPCYRGPDGPPATVCGGTVESAGTLSPYGHGEEYVTEHPTPHSIARTPLRSEPSRSEETTASPLRSLSDDELLRRLVELLQQSRRVEVVLVAHIGEVDTRRLYAREACPSMFAYCTEVLHLSEQEAYLRIAAARAAREHAMLLPMLADGRLHLSGIAKLAPHLTRANREALLERAAHKSKRRIEELVAELAPGADVPALTRKLPEPRRAEPSLLPPSQAHARADPELGLDRVPTAAVPAPVRPAIVQPLSPARYKVQFTASAAFHDKLERLKALIRSSVPDGDLAAILEDAVTEKLERLEARRFGMTKAPRKELAATETSAPSSRYIPAAVRRAVYERDGGQCRYSDDGGRRCSARRHLEFHHVEPHARGGDRSPENIRLMCRAHNAYLAERDYGEDLMARYRRAPTHMSEGPASPSDSEEGPCALRPAAT